VPGARREGAGRRGPERGGKDFPGTDVRRVSKPWGHGLIFAENERYAGKILHLEAGPFLSLPYPQPKDGTLYVRSGEVLLEVGQDGALTRLRLKAGEAFRIEPGTRHRMSAEVATDLVEVSSPELDDVVRLEDRYGRAGTTAP